MTKIKGGVLVYVVVMSLVVFLVIGLMLSRDYQEYSRLDLVVERDWIRVLSLLFWKKNLKYWIR